MKAIKKFPSIFICIFTFIYINIYTPGQEYKTTLKNKEIKIVYNF